MNALRYTIAAAAASLGLFVGHAPAAHADQWDYVIYLDNNGVSYSTVTGVISLGKESCHHLRGGGHYLEVMDVLTGPLGYTSYEGAAIVAGAVGYMCPDADPVLQQQLGNAPTDSTPDQLA